MRQLGSILLEEGVLTQEQLLDAVDEQQQRGQSLGRTLVEMGLISEGQLVRALASQVGMEFVDLSDFPVEQTAVARVSAAVCRRHTALPIQMQGDVLNVAL
ncbi:MAG: type II secretion system protein GspE, partial [Demequina sp.]